MQFTAVNPLNTNTFLSSVTGILASLAAIGSTFADAPRKRPWNLSMYVKGSRPLLSPGANATQPVQHRSAPRVTESSY